MADITHFSSKSPPHRPWLTHWRSMAAAVLVFWILAVTTLYVARREANRYYMAQLQMRSEKMRGIWDSLQRARNILGHFPLSMDEWSSVEPRLDELITTPPGSTTPQYAISFQRLSGGGIGIVTADPRVKTELDPRGWRVAPWYRHGERVVRLVLRADGTRIQLQGDEMLAEVDSMYDGQRSNAFK